MSLSIKSAKASHPLAAAVLRQLGGGAEAIQSAIDAANHGADSGFHGFIYTRECVSFSERNRPAILACLSDMASDFGEPTSKLLAGFRCLKDITDPMSVLAIGRKHEDYDTVANALAWFALEEVGHAIEAAQEALPTPSQA